MLRGMEDGERVRPTNQGRLHGKIVLKPVLEGPDWSGHMEKRWGQQREAPDAGSLGHVLEIQRGPARPDGMGTRLLRLSGESVRGFELQDEEFDLVPEAPGSHARLRSREGPRCLSGRVGRTDRGGWAGRWLPEQSWRKTVRHEPGKDRGDREK